jgi:hypothetical protein
MAITSATTNDGKKAIDAAACAANNCSMSTEAEPTLDADTKALLAWLADGTPLPCDVRKRIQERGDELTEEIRQKYGTVEIAVDLIREIRDGG